MARKLRSAAPELAPGAIRRASPYHTWIDCVEQLSEDLPYRTRPKLTTALHSCWQSIPSALDEAAMSRMHGWWDYDLDGLLARRAKWSGALPRIVLDTRINRAKNLVVTWMPLGVDKEAEALTGGCDWLEWQVSTPFGGRPSNELLFVRDVGQLIHYAGDNHSSPVAPDPTNKIVAEILLRATQALWLELCERLERSFQITFRGRIVAEWIEPPSPTNLDDLGTATLKTWRIDPV